MPITPEEKARIARENGARSKGPITEGGKIRSSMNAFKNGNRANRLRLLVPSHTVLTSLDDRKEYFIALQQNAFDYGVVSHAELRIVAQITETNWRLDRLHRTETAMLNREILRLADADAGTDEPTDLDEPDELRLERLYLAAYESVNATPTIARIHKQAAACERTLNQLEARLFRLRKNVPASNATRVTAIQEQLQHLFSIDADEPTESVAVDAAEDDEQTNQPEPPAATTNPEPETPKQPEKQPEPGIACYIEGTEVDSSQIVDRMNQLRKIMEGMKHQQALLTKERK